MASATVTDINERRPHWSGPALCTRCGHEWRACVPADATDELECPECKTFFGIKRGPHQPVGRVWTCKCGGDLFYLTPDGHMCRQCGRTSWGWNDDT